MNDREMLDALKLAYHAARTLHKSQPEAGREAALVRGYADQISDSLEPVILDLVYRVYDIDRTPAADVLSSHGEG